MNNTNYVNYSHYQETSHMQPYTAASNNNNSKSRNHHNNNHYTDTSSAYQPVYESSSRSKALPALDPEQQQQTNEEEDERKIEVQILPQDDWGVANSTAMTADFSDANDDLMTKDDDRFSQYYPGNVNQTHNSGKNVNSHDFNSSSKNKMSIISFLKTYFGYLFTVLVIFASFLTPILFIVLPKLVNILNDSPIFSTSVCGIECEGLLIGIAFKMFILVLGSWAIFCRKPRNILPKLNELRALLVFFLLIMTFSFWLFYGVRILDVNASSEFDYIKILQFASSYVEVLLFIYVLSVFIVELKHLRCEYLVTVYRSPDGEQKTYSIGRMSIQRASLWLLEQYYRDFRPYNPWLENAHRKRAVQLMHSERQLKNANSRSKDKSEINGSNGDKMADAQSYKRNKLNSNVTAQDRLLEEMEFEKRLKKKRTKLMLVTEEAFKRVRRAHRMDYEDEPNIVIDPMETAQAIFSTIARDLRRYLRVTRQQPFFSRDSILNHLAQCISYDISPKAFLDRYVNGESLGFNERALVNSYVQTTRKYSGIQSENESVKTDQNWILICEDVLYQSVADGLMVVLKQGEVSLMCTFKRLPKFRLIEDILDPKRNKFVLKLNSETTV